ncbi:MAG TPA: hypothetical protein VIL84_02420 [Devosiaceae bacterium]
MKPGTLARLGGILFLTIGLAGCFDATMDIKVLGDNKAQGTVTISLDKAIYDMGQGNGSSSDFCTDGTLTTTATTVTCTTSKDGTFDEINFDDSSPDGTPAPNVTIKQEQPGLVRVTFPTKALQTDIGDSASDAQSRQMMVSMFAGHSMTFSISGGEIVDTNMTLAPDRQSAKLVIPFSDVINRTADIPGDAYAVVKLR